MNKKKANDLTKKQLKAINARLEQTIERIINEHARNTKVLCELSVLLQNLQIGGEALDTNKALLK